jgi:hypothetical protein
MMSMAALLAPASSADLALAMSERRRLFVRSDDRTHFRDLLPWSTVNTLFSINRFVPGQIRVLRASTDVQPSMYRDHTDWSYLKVDALQALAAQGLSVVVNDIQSLVPAIAALTAMTERHFRSLTSVNAYISFKRSGAFRPHWDGHDVLILQIHGSKRWRTYGMGDDRPTDGHTFAQPTDAGAVQWEEVLHPGDVLYLPRGEVHAADVEPGSTSVHLTLGIVPPRGNDVLRWLAKGSKAALRGDVSPAWNADERRQHEAALKEAMHRLVDSLDLDVFFAAMDREREARPAANFGAILAIDPGTWLASALPRRVPMPPAQEGSVTFTVGTSTYRLSEAAAALLALLQERDAMTIDTATAVLGEFDTDAVYRAASDLAQKGLIYAGLDGSAAP